MARILSIEETRPADSSKQSTTNSPSRRDQFIRRGELWQLPPGHNATIAFSPGIIAMMLDGGELQIQKLQLTKDGNETGDDMMEREVELKLTAGSLIAWISADGLKSSLSIATDLGTISARSDSLFYLQKSADFIHITCVRGALGLTNPDGRLTMVPPGKWIERRKGENDPIEPQAASANARVEEEIAAALERETAMQTLVIAERKEVPLWRLR